MLRANHEDELALLLPPARRRRVADMQLGLNGLGHMDGNRPVPADVLTTAPSTRFRSRRDHTFAKTLSSALSAEFGGHVEPR